MPYLLKNKRPLLALALLGLSEISYANHPVMEELVVVDVHNNQQINVAESIEINPDAAALLRKAPGANVNGNGPLTGIPQYRGMYGSRINVEVNGMMLSSGGPNWMDPPLSYAPAAQLQSLIVYRGIAPVSAGQETIGGAIVANTWSGEFGQNDSFETSGQLRVGIQSVNDASLASAAVVAANQHHLVKLSALTEQANDAQFPEGNIVPTEYERQRYDLAYGYQANNQTVLVDFARNETGDSGTPALPMDIVYIDSDLASVRYSLNGSDWQLKAKVYASEIKHGMTNYALREPPIASQWRRNTATGDNLGFKIDYSRNDQTGQWLVGVDHHNELHNSRIDNPNNGLFFVTNFNDAERAITGLFAERQQTLNEHWQAQWGLRYNHVTMDAGRVDGTPAMMTMMGMAPGMLLRESFNNSQRQQTDDNIDWMAKVTYQYNENTAYYAGLARKTRSPSYQERYLWLPLESTAGLADGRTYTGNIDLNPEVAHEIEGGIDVSVGALSLSPRLFYREVDDFIQGTESTNSAAMMFVSMMNTMNGTSNAEPLEFNNVDAEFYGFDMSWEYQIDARWSLDGIVNYVRGQRGDINDNLYRVAPANLLVALHYQTTQWGVTVESVLNARQHKISATNTEQYTQGYGLLGVKGYWQFNTEVRLGFGIDNLLDKHYSDHLAGYNRVVNDDLARGERLPGFARNVFARIDYQW